MHELRHAKTTCIYDEFYKLFQAASASPPKHLNFSTIFQFIHIFNVISLN